MNKWSWLFLLLGCSAIQAQTINFDVNYQTVNFTGTPVQAITVNNRLPGPVLHFHEGETVTIFVHNNLHKETAIHWHGMLVPWQMDGVLGVSQKGIPPGGTFRYRFKLEQSGTYWYHAHAGLQEQQGLYGALIVDPATPPNYHYTKDFPIVLSDWSNTKPEQIYANLKKSGEYYSPKFPLQASLLKFLTDYHHAGPEEKHALWSDYKMMQQSRMGLYDLSDVAYDAFLLNGHAKTQPWQAQVKLGDIVRLRFIGAAGSTIFQVKIPGVRMQMVHIQGNDVKPYYTDSFIIAPGETYDVLIKIQHSKPYIIYAESLDKVGAAMGALVQDRVSPTDYNSVNPFPNPMPPSRQMMALQMQDHHGMHHNMQMQTEPAIHHDSIKHETIPIITKGTPYQDLKAAVKTNNPNKPVDGVIRMELFGYMDQYIWFVNGVPEYKAPPIILEPNKRYRFVFTNPSMMRHPMHLHGHWFILRNDHGSFDPLLHTIDVPPGATVTADVDTDASGQWFFHCHLLYHMVAGMGRVFQYSTLIELTEHKIQPEDIIKPTFFHNRPIVRVDEVMPIVDELVQHPMPHEKGFYFASNLEVGEDAVHNVQKLTYKGLYGPDYNKLQLYTNDAEIEEGTATNADIDIFYWHLLNQFWAVKGGMNYFNRPAIVPYWQPGIGIEGLLPYFIQVDARGYYFQGSAKLDLEVRRDTQITNNFFIGLGVRSIMASKTVPRAQLGNGLNQVRYTITPYYRLTPWVNVFAEYEYQKNYVEFRKLQLGQDESASENTFTLGLSFLL